MGLPKLSIFFIRNRKQNINKNKRMFELPEIRTSVCLNIVLFAYFTANL